MHSRWYRYQLESFFFASNSQFDRLISEIGTRRMITVSFATESDMCNSANILVPV